MKVSFLIAVLAIVYSHHCYTSGLFNRLVDEVKKEKIPVIWADGKQSKPLTSQYNIDESPALLRVKMQSPYQLLQTSILKENSFNERIFIQLFEKACNLTREESLWEDFKDICYCCFSRTEEEIEREEQHELGKKILTYLNVLHASEHQKKNV